MASGFGVSGLLASIRIFASEMHGKLWVSSGIAMAGSGLLLRIICFFW